MMTSLDGSAAGAKYVRPLVLNPTATFVAPTKSAAAATTAALPNSVLVMNLRSGPTSLPTGTSGERRGPLKTWPSRQTRDAAGT
jgi:hypothetical protein